ncbi:MAG: thioredoxin [Firmicutes bacterium]|nr:thioredoxin [Bacillota bacterium]
MQVTDASFVKEVLEHKGEPVLVDFWAPWCMPCRILGPIIDRLAQAYAGKVKVVKLNVDENPIMAQKYDIMAIPTMIVFQDGKIVKHIAGLLPEGQLRQVLEEVLAA